MILIYDEKNENNFVSGSYEDRLEREGVRGRPPMKSINRMDNY